LFVLPRRNLVDSSRRSVLNPLSFMRLQPLCVQFSTPLLCFQWFAASFSRTPGVGCTQQKPPSRITNVPARRPRTVCKPVTLASLGSICKPFPFISLRIALSASPLFSQSSALPPCVFPAQRNRTTRVSHSQIGNLLGAPRRSLRLSVIFFLGFSEKFKPFNVQLSTVNRASPQLECM
jgi:hypothetical protein